jgi:ADP-ribosylglycohydrolase
MANFYQSRRVFVKGIIQRPSRNPAFLDGRQLAVVPISLLCYIRRKRSLSEGLLHDRLEEMVSMGNIQNAKAMVLATFLADALALGVHWIYDTKRIDEQFGRVENLRKPPADSFHPTKDRGDFTHYGDQTLVLLESISQKNDFDIDDFAEKWRRFFLDYDGYFDQATKGTLHNISAGKSPEEAGSVSDDLAGAARIAPIVFRYREDIDSLKKAAALQTRMTHNNPVVIDTAVFFALVAQSVLAGKSPLAAMEETSQEGFRDSPLGEWVREGIASKDLDSIPSIKRFGQSCHTESAFPGVVHLIGKYENDLKEALVQCVMAGGDSAGRGMLVGMILGAHTGKEGIPDEWVAALNHKDHIMNLLNLFNHK